MVTDPTTSQTIENALTAANKHPINIDFGIIQLAWCRKGEEWNGLAGFLDLLQIGKTKVTIILGTREEMKKCQTQVLRYFERKFDMHKQTLTNQTAGGVFEYTTEVMILTNKDESHTWEQMPIRATREIMTIQDILDDEHQQLPREFVGFRKLTRFMDIKTPAGKARIGNTSGQSNGNL